MSTCCWSWVRGRADRLRGIAPRIIPCYLWYRNLSLEEVEMPAATAVGEQINLQPLEIRTVKISIVGETPLITHRWSEKARRMMLDAQTGKARVKKPPKDPAEDFEEATYRLGDGTFGMPAAAFKAAIVAGARAFEGVTMTGLKTQVRVIGEGVEQLVRVIGDRQMFESPVRLQSGVADLRYRPIFPEWSAELEIRYPSALLSLDSLVHLVNAGGMSGVGEWRPSSPKSSTGMYGTFRVTEGQL